MLGIDPLTFGSLMVMAAAPICKMDGQTAINVNPRTLSVKYDYSLSLEQLQRYQSDTIDPATFGQASYTQGLMHGSIKLVPRVRMKYRTFTREKLACVWYDEIDVTIEIDPTIMIAREVYNDRCMREAVIEHELKHVKIDRMVVNKFAQAIGRKLYEELQSRGFKSAVFPEAQRDAVIEHMQRVAFDLIELEYRKMDIERIELQRELDSREEYERVGALCPHFDGDQYFRQLHR